MISFGFCTDRQTHTQTLLKQYLLRQHGWSADINPLKRSGVSWLHFKVFCAVQLNGARVPQYQKLKM